jgi:Tol biopolymer transport system component
MMPLLAALILLAVDAWSTEGVVFPSSEHPSYSPDGKQIAFVADALGGLNIWIASADGSDLRRLTHDLGTKQKDPSWSPDGSRIAFASNKSGNFDIWLIQTDGNNAVQLTTDPSADEQPAWFPDGSKIAFVSNRGGTKDIWTMAPDGGGLQRLTALVGQENHPSFSPSGDRLVFSESTARQSNLMIANANGTGLQFLTSGTSRDLYPTWTSKGIVFSSNRDGSFALWLIQPDGSGLQQIQNTRDGFDPVLSPDGMLVTFAGTQQDGSQNIVATNLVTGSTQTVTNIKRFFVDIHIKPGSSGPTPINASARGKIPVAILSSRNFDATTDVDRASLSFGSTGDEKSLSFCNPGGEDVSGDGLPDLICHFNTPPTAFSPLDTIAILRGQTTRGLRIEGRGAVRILR